MIGQKRPVARQLMWHPTEDLAKETQDMWKYSRMGTSLGSQASSRCFLRWEGIVGPELGLGRM